MVLKAGTSFECSVFKKKNIPLLQNSKKAVEDTEGSFSLAHPHPLPGPRQPLRTPTSTEFLGHPPTRFFRQIKVNVKSILISPPFLHKTEHTLQLFCILTFSHDDIYTLEISPRWNTEHSLILPCGLPMLQGMDGPSFL